MFEVKWITRNYQDLPSVRVRTRSYVIKIILNKLVGFTEEFQSISFWRSRDTVIFCKHVVSEVQILMNGFIFLLSIKCFMTVEGQLQKVTDKLNRNLPIMVVL